MNSCSNLPEDFAYLEFRKSLKSQFHPCTTLITFPNIDHINTISTQLISMNILHSATDRGCLSCRLRLGLLVLAALASSTAAQFLPGHPFSHSAQSVNCLVSGDPHALYHVKFCTKPNAAGSCFGFGAIPNFAYIPLESFKGGVFNNVISSVVICSSK